MGAENAVCAGQAGLTTVALVPVFVLLGVAALLFDKVTMRGPAGWFTFAWVDIVLYDSLVISERV